MKRKMRLLVVTVLAVMLAVTAIVTTACGESEPSETATVVKIKLDTTDVKTEFEEGDDFVFDGLKVIAEMRDGTTNEIALSDCDVSAPDMSTAGVKTVAVTYSGCKATYRVTINAAPVPHVCELKCPVCGKCMDVQCEDPVCVDKCGDVQGYKTYTLQGEDDNAVYIPGSTGMLGMQAVKDEPDAVSEEVKERNADIVYVSNFINNIGAAIEFNFWSDKDATATLEFSVGKRITSATLTDDVAVTVNDERISRETKVPATGTITETWADFVDVSIGCISLKSGMNKIRLENVSAIGWNYNIDCIRLKTDATIGWAEDDLILADTDMSGYDAVINMAYNKDFVMAEVYEDLMEQYGKTFPAYKDHMGGATEVGADGKCFDGTVLNGQTIEFDFYMISKGTAYINFYMAAPEGYTKEDMTANMKFILDDTEITAENIFFNTNKSFGGRADSGKKNPFVRVRIGMNGSEYNDLAAGAHKLTLQFIGDNAPDFDVIAIRPWSLGKYYVHTAISADTSAAVTQFSTGAAFTTDGLVINATKLDGSQESVPVDDCLIIAPDMTTEGEKTVTVYYGRLSASYKINVGAALVTPGTEETVPKVTEGTDA